MANSGHNEKQAKIAKQALDKAWASLLDCEALFKSIRAAAGDGNTKINPLPLADIGARISGGAQLAIGAAEDAIRDASVLDRRPPNHSSMLRVVKVDK